MRTVRPRSWLNTVLARFSAALALVSLACQPAPVPFEVHTSALDPELMTLGDGSFVQHFNGEPSAIKLGQGWLGPEPRPNPEKAWAAKRAMLYFPTPVGGAIDLVAYCTRFAYPDAPVQRVQPILNGSWQPAIELADSWGELRIPLPNQALDPRLNTLELLFDYAARPNEVTSSAANRPVSTLFESIALVPRGWSFDEGVTSASTFDSTTQQLSLTEGRRGVTLPVPPVSSFNLNIGSVESSGPGTLSLRLITVDGEPQELWQGNLKDADGLALTVSHPAGSHAQLAIEVLSTNPTAGHARAAEPVTVTLSLGPDVIAPPPRAAPRKGAPPHVFVYMIDTLRADALGVYGAERPTSPNIDRFASGSVVFDNAWSPSAWTLPATASVLTGVYPSRHGRTKGSVRGPGDNAPISLAERLGKQGYSTIGISQTYIASRAYGLDRGFDAFYLNDVLGHWTRDSNSIRWFLWHHLLGRSVDDAPLFVYSHSVAPHSPYIPQGHDARFAEHAPGDLPVHQYQPHIFMDEGFGSNTEETAHLRALYDGEVIYSDRHFGAFLDLLEYLDLYDNSIIVLLSDHGEEFYEHGGFDHSRTLFQELLHVPLIVKLPAGQHAGTRVGDRVSTVDIVPTILELATNSATGTDSLDGISLLRTLAPDAPAERRVVFAEVDVDPARDRYAAVAQAAIVSGNIKCIHSKNEVDRFFQPVASYRAYDLAADPKELHPLPESDAAAQRCFSALKQWTERVSSSTPEAGQAEPLSDEERARLEALGYL